MRGRETAKTVVCCVARFPFAGKARLQQWLQIWTVDNTTQWDSVLIDSWLWPNSTRKWPMFLALTKPSAPSESYVDQTAFLSLLVSVVSVCMLAEKEVFCLFVFILKMCCLGLGYVDHKTVTPASPHSNTPPPPPFQCCFTSAETLETIRDRGLPKCLAGERGNNNRKCARVLLSN